MKLANLLVSENKSVVVVLQAPLLGSDISSYILRAVRTNQSDVAALPRSEWRELNSAVYTATQSLDPRVAVIDMADYFCDELNCYAVRDGQALYFDDDHMSLYGAKRAANDLVQLFE